MSDGFLNILKPPGMSSHDIVGVVRRILKTKKVGHAGTLDPGAAGVLPVAVGRATRLVEYLAAVDKSYRAELLFGIATDSGDDTGVVVDAQSDFEMPSPERLRQAMLALTGEITQIPPAHSAIKINGQKACDLVRQHIAVEIPKRQVHIYRFELLEKRAQTLLLDVDCSKGTYIRTLCTDLGKVLGVPATMSFLVRTRVGAFHLRDAYTLEELQLAGEKALLPAEAYLTHLPRYEIAAHRVKAFCNGLSTHDRAAELTNTFLRVYNAEKFLGIGRYRQETQEIIPEKVFTN